MDGGYDNASDLFVTMPGTTKAGGTYGGMIGGVAYGGDAYGGDGSLEKNANRAFGWFIAAIVASVIVSIILMLVAFVFGIKIDLLQMRSNASHSTLVIIALLSVGIGFATAGSVYESWVGCH